MGRLDQAEKSGESKSGEPLWPSAKKWYIASGEIFLGPLSDEEMSFAVEAGEVGAAALVWGPETGEWRKAAELPAFPKDRASREAVGLSSALIERFALSPAVIEKPVSDVPKGAEIPAPAFALPEHEIVERNLQVTPSLDDEIKGPPPPALAPTAVAPRGRTPSVWSWAVAIAAASAVAVGLVVFTRPMPWPMPLPEGERLRLLETLRGSPGAPSAAIAFSPDNIMTPRLVVVVSDRRISEVTASVRGVTGTLLGAYRFEADVSVPLNEGRGATEPIRQANGAALVPGFYRVDIHCSSCAEPGRLGQDVFFWGGVEGRGYRADLSKYQRKLIERSKIELEEIRQLAEAIRGQHLESLTQFTGAEAGAFVSFSGNWLGFQNQITTLIESQDRPESLQIEAYRSLRVLAHQVAALHREQLLALTGNGTETPVASVVAMKSREMTARLDSWLKRVKLTEANSTDSAGRPILISEGM